MKKYITLAALLAAGTTFADAATANWDFEKSGFYLNGEEVAAEGAFKIRLTFDFDSVDFNNTESGLVLFQMESAQGDIVQWKSKDANFSGNASTYVVNDFSVNSGGHYTAARLNGSNEMTFDFYEGTSMGIKVSTRFVTNNGDAPATSTEQWSNKFNFSGDVVVWDSLTVDKCISNCTVVLEADSLTVVPEPSAFGLLAGLGALALVASRRRRR